MSSRRGTLHPALSGKLLHLPRSGRGYSRLPAPRAVRPAPSPLGSQPRRQILHFKQLTEIPLQMQTLDPMGLAGISIFLPP